MAEPVKTKQSKILFKLISRPNDSCYIFEDPVNTTSVNDDCKECVLDYYLDSSKKCVLRPHLTLQNCINFDTVSNECLECEDGFVLDSDPSPFCAWNRKKFSGDINAENAVKFWGNLFIFLM